MLLTDNRSMLLAHALSLRSRACCRRYILWEAEEQGLLLPYACRMGCCTACAVRIKEGEMYQPQVITHVRMF